MDRRNAVAREDRGRGVRIELAAGEALQLLRESEPSVEVFGDALREEDCAKSSQLLSKKRIFFSLEHFHPPGLTFPMCIFTEFLSFHVFFPPFADTKKNIASCSPPPRGYGYVLRHLHSEGQHISEFTWASIFFLCNPPRVRTPDQTRSRNFHIFDSPDLSFSLYFSHSLATKLFPLVPSLLPQSLPEALPHYAHPSSDNLERQ